MIIFLIYWVKQNIVLKSISPSSSCFKKKMWLLDNLKLRTWLTFAALINLYYIALVTISTHSGL